MTAIALQSKNKFIKLKSLFISTCIVATSVTVSHAAVNVIKDLSITSNAYQYAGYYSDLETGLEYLKARYRSVKFGFISKDDYELLNKYNYVDGNPVNNVDPTGHIPKWLRAILNLFCCGYFAEEVNEENKKIGNVDVNINDNYMQPKLSEIIIPHLKPQKSGFIQDMEGDWYYGNMIDDMIDEKSLVNANKHLKYSLLFNIAININDPFKGDNEKLNKKQIEKLFKDYDSCFNITFEYEESIQKKIDSLWFDKEKFLVLATDHYFKRYKKFGSEIMGEADKFSKRVIFDILSSEKKNGNKLSVIQEEEEKKGSFKHYLNDY